MNKAEQIGAGPGLVVACGLSSEKPKEEGRHPDATQGSDSGEPAHWAPAPMVAVSSSLVLRSVPHTLTSGNTQGVTAATFQVFRKKQQPEGSGTGPLAASHLRGGSSPGRASRARPPVAGVRLLQCPHVSHPLSGCGQTVPLARDASLPTAFPAAPWVPGRSGSLRTEILAQPRRLWRHQLELCPERVNCDTGR